jgi:hypothetical protein
VFLFAFSDSFIESLGAESETLANAISFGLIEREELVPGLKYKDYLLLLIEDTSLFFTVGENLHQMLVITHAGQLYRVTSTRLIANPSSAGPKRVILCTQTRGTVSDRAWH